MTALVLEQDELTTADGTRLALWRSGDPDASTTIVLAHGWTLDTRSWQPLIGELQRRLPGVAFLGYDHRGHGRSDTGPDGTSTIAQLGRDMAEVLTTRTSGRIVLIGHSMGGMAMMALAEHERQLVADRVAAAAFVATSSGNLGQITLGLRGPAGRWVARNEAKLWTGRAVGTRYLSRPKATLGSPSTRPALRWFLFGPKPRRDDVDLTLRCLADCRPTTVFGFRPTFTDHDRRVALAAFAGVPTLVFAGDRDRLTPVGHAERIAEELPDGGLVVFPGAGHMLPLERSSQIADRLAALVGSVQHR